MPVNMFTTDQKDHRQGKANAGSNGIQNDASKQPRQCVGDLKRAEDLGQISVAKMKLGADDRSKD